MKKPNPKWHYFNLSNRYCRQVINNKFRTVNYTTICSRDLKDIRRHTELKSYVTCLNCLRKLNNLDKGD